MSANCSFRLYLGNLTIHPGKDLEVQRIVIVSIEWTNLHWRPRRSMRRAFRAGLQVQRQMFLEFN